MHVHVVPHSPLQAHLDRPYESVIPMCCGLAVLPIGIATGLVCSLKGDSVIIPASLGSRGSSIDGQRRDAASSFRAKKMLWARASQCGQPITHGRTRRSILRTIFELLARRLDGHEDRCSFQDLIAQSWKNNRASRFFCVQIAER